MKKTCLVMTMVFLTMFLTTGCGYRLQVIETDNAVTEEYEEYKETYASTESAVDLVMTEAATESIADLSTTEDRADVAENVAKTRDYQVFTDVPTIVSGLPEEPEWNIEEFGSIEDFKDFCSTMSIPKVITDIYDEHKKKGTLNNRGEVEFWGAQDVLPFMVYQDKDKKYAQYAPFFVVYQDKDKKYRISYMDSTCNAEEVVGQGCFRSKDNNLVIISVLTYCNNSSLGNTSRYYLPEHYSKFFREEISEDHISMRTEYLDTALLKDRNFKKVMVCPEFTVLFYPDTNQLLCVKDSTPIGPKTNVDSVDLEGLNWKRNKTILNKENTLVYSVIVQNEEEGTSFEILHVAEDVSSLSSKTLWVEKNGARYPVVNQNNEKSIYYLEDAKGTNYKASYSAYGFAGEVGWIISAEDPIIVNGSAEVKKYDFKYDDFYQYELWDSVESGYICIAATNDNLEMKLYTNMDSPEYCIYSAQKENKFPEYITEDGAYRVPTYADLQKVLEGLGIEVE